jgi:hypothetical protein
MIPLMTSNTDTKIEFCLNGIANTSIDMIIAGAAK